MDHEKYAETLIRIDERTIHILDELKRLNGTVKKHNEEIENLKTTQERHRTYFKIIGSAIGIIVIVVCALLPFLLKH